MPGIAPGAGNQKGSGNATTKLKQATIPGHEEPKFPEVTKAASAYLALRKQRMALEVEERKERDRLTERMNKRGIKTYKFEEETLEAYIPDKDEPQAKVRTLVAEED